MKNMILKWKLMINKNLYDDKIIDIYLYNKMQEKILNKLSRLEDK